MTTQPATDPRTSARIFFLSQFLEPRERYTEGWFRSHAWDEWWKVLGEPPTQTIDRLSGDGLLEPADLAERVDHKYKLAELKELAKQRGLKTTGKKDDLVARLIEADRAAMESATADVTLVKCSLRGRETVEPYLAQEQARRTAAEQKISAAIERRDFPAAIAARSEYEAAQVFPTWRGDATHEAGVLGYILAAAPPGMESATSAELEKVRGEAIHEYFWGGQAKSPLLTMAWGAQREEQDHQWKAEQAANQQRLAQIAAPTARPGPRARGASSQAGRGGSFGLKALAAAVVAIVLLGLVALYALFSLPGNTSRSSSARPEATRTLPAATSARSGCSNSYPDVCIPPPPPNLNCSGISHRNFKVQGSDPHGFDTDGDGIGCESN